MVDLPLTVVETPEFLAATQKLLNCNERDKLIDFLAHNPKAGDLIPGAGGVRKLRWMLQGRGKRGGARVIYYFHSERIPLFALSLYAKNQKADLSSDEIDRLRLVVKSIAASARKKE
jgi:mRNA-degrading endonuclease RelE of RelBE toxin-antitoxin system